MRTVTKVMLTAALAALPLAVPIAGADAQSYFGQNQVQYDHFDWKVLETEHFLVHYYPEERVAAIDAARMAERSYARLSRLLGHQFREKKPILLFASRSDFGQNNVTGDLGEFTGAVADALRHRMLVPFTGDYRTFEHVMTHEMVHAFQYDIFARGKAGQGLQQLAQVNPPLWFIEGMAEYLSIGPDHPQTETILRDAALNGNIPSIEDMTMRPDRWFPYRYGEALWKYVGERWGDAVIGDIMNAIPTMGIEKAFKRELGLSMEELGEEWKEALQVKHLPQVAIRDRPRKFSQPLLSERRTNGGLFVAPALSNDGKLIAFVSTGSFLKGEVFPDLWLGDAETGKRLKRLVKTTTNPDFEELRLLYSQSAFSPDGKYLAFTAQRRGKDVLYLLDVKRRKTVERFRVPVEQVLNPSFSPDGRRLVFSGNIGGTTDLYTVDIDGRNFRRLTNDQHGDLMPQWSPDGRSVAFVSDRGPETDFSVLRMSTWMISILDVETGRVETPANQAGLNLNPMWAPDGKSIAYISDRTGIANLFLYDLGDREHYQLTNVMGSVGSVTELSPAITWARQADRLAYVYFENGDYTVWNIQNPRSLKGKPYRDSTATPAANVLASGTGRDTVARGGAAGQGPVQVALSPDSARRLALFGAAPGGGVTTDSTLRVRSFYRAPEGVRVSSELGSADRSSVGTISVAALLDSAALALPDTSKFKAYRYRVAFQPEYVARPTIGYAQDNWGNGVFGGTTIILSDLLGNHRLAFSGQVNGRLSEAQVFAAYTNLSRRWQWQGGIFQTPLFIVGGSGQADVDGIPVLRTAIVRYIVRQAFGVGMYPFNRFTRLEAGARYNNVDQAIITIDQQIYGGAYLGPPRYGPSDNAPGLNYVAPYLAHVSDNTLFGYTGPISGRRWRFQIEPTVGSFRWVNYLADYRRYDPILFNFLTFSTRVMSNVSVGPDEAAIPNYIGNPLFIRGYDRQNFFNQSCFGGVLGSVSQCNTAELAGSRFALANAELRFPVVRRFDLGLLPISLPPLDGLVFYDAGVAWYGGQEVSVRRPDNYNPDEQRYLLRSYGAGLRLNLFGFAIVRWDYAIPLDSRAGRKGFWNWSLGPSF
jgi:WD40 repeat protein